jgi:hypothetical protein
MIEHFPSSMGLLDFLPSMKKKKGKETYVVFCLQNLLDSWERTLLEYDSFLESRMFCFSRPFGPWFVL